MTKYNLTLDYANTVSVLTESLAKSLAVLITIADRDTPDRVMEVAAESAILAGIAKLNAIYVVMPVG